MWLVIIIGLIVLLVILFWVFVVDFDIPPEIILMAVILSGILLGVEYKFKYSQYIGINVTVKDGDEILYRGNSAFYDIQSMGTATYFVQREPNPWFPRILNERVSNNITVIKE